METMFSRGGGFWVSTDNGTSWVQRTEGMGNLYVNTLCISNGYIFAGTDGYGVWRRPLSELVGVETISNTVPKEFKLFQNYPNPFNAMTNIKYQVAKNNSNILITISDINGRLISELVNQKQNAGIYEVSWDASEFSSGVYFYRLIVNSKIIKSNKMILSK
jgi:hypothetical protein